MKVVRQPLFQFDPGWLFLVAGLAICAAGIIIPAEDDIAELRTELSLLQDEEAAAYRRLAAYSSFLEALDAEDPTLIRRLAAAQLNLVPDTATPVLMSTSASESVRSWIEAPLRETYAPEELRSRSRLQRWAAGPHQLWMIGLGALAVFVGLLPRSATQ